MMWLLVKTLAPNPKIAGKWMLIPLELIIIGFDPSPCADLLDEKGNGWGNFMIFLNVPEPVEAMVEAPWFSTVCMRFFGKSKYSR